jgi:hypothetical protein
MYHWPSQQFHQPIAPLDMMVEAVGKQAQEIHPNSPCSRTFAIFYLDLLNYVI